MSTERWDDDRLDRLDALGARLEIAASIADSNARALALRPDSISIS